MKMTRISIPISIDEREQLRAMAKVNLRNPREYARFILHSVLFGEQPEETNLGQNKNTVPTVQAGNGVFADKLT